MRDRRPANDPPRGHIQGFLRFFGAMLLVPGIVLTSMGAISLFSSWGSIGAARYYWADLLRLPLITMGSVLAQFANLEQYHQRLS